MVQPARTLTPAEPEQWAALAEAGVARLATRCLATVCGFLVVITLTVGPAGQAGAHETSEHAPEIRDIVLPIDVQFADVVTWSDTFGAPRSGGRSHEGVDMMGPKMVPLIAAADGVVSWMRHDTVRGNNLDITDAEGWTYHYVHINNDTPGTDDGANSFEFAFAPGIERGAPVSAGQDVGYMGDSGNAESVGPGLHFEISRPDGTPLNPTASVDAALERAEQVVAVDDLGPYASTNELLNDVLGTLRGADAVAPERASLVDSINSDGLAPTIETLVGVESRAAAIDRLYVAFFRRPPDYGGYRYWIGRQSEGLGLVDAADLFAESPEYQDRYGHLSFEDFLDLLYGDVLGRAPDDQGKRYWLERLEDPGDPVTRGSIVAFFSESEELKSLTADRSEIVALTALFEDRRPTQAEIEQWISQRSTESFPQTLAARFGIT